MNNKKVRFGTKVSTTDKMKSTFPASDVNVSTTIKTPVAGKFEKVSFDTFLSSLLKISNQETIDEEFKSHVQNIYDHIILPHRMTPNNPIYNIYFPFGETTLIPNQTLLVPTGIKVKLNEGWVLQCTINPLLAINNDLFTHEIITYITGDRYNNEIDEGMIMFKIVNNSKMAKECVLQRNTRLCSCLFVPYGLSSNDMVENSIEA